MFTEKDSIILGYGSKYLNELHREKVKNNEEYTAWCFSILYLLF